MGPAGIARDAITGRLRASPSAPGGRAPHQRRLEWRSAPEGGRARVDRAGPAQIYGEGRAMRDVFVVRKVDRNMPEVPEAWVYETRAEAEAKLEALTVEVFGEGVIELYRIEIKERTVH